MKPLLRFEFEGETLTLCKAAYRDGSLAYVVQAEDGEPYTTLSVWFSESALLGPGQFYAKVWSENEELVKELLAQGLFEECGGWIESGFVHAPVWRLKEQANEPSEEI
jgi:hypothetical protein